MAGKNRANSARRVVVWGIWTLALCALAPGLASVGAPMALAHESETPVQQAVTLDSPAVVRIVSVVQARLTCSACATSGADVISPAQGSDPFTYYSSGSGAFISPDGAILTADHVVDHSMTNTEDVGFVEQQASQDIAPRYNDTPDHVLQFLQANPDKVSITFTILFQRAFLSTAYTGNLHDTSHIYAFDVSSIVASSPVDKQDTAIIRINTSGVTPAPDFPYLTLSTQRVQALDTVTAIAYPADADLALNNADVTALVNPAASDPNTITSLLSPSVNSGSVTNANEVRSDGTPVYEANGISSQGSSGGPVINDQGQVIGFVDAGPATNRLTFIIPSTVVAKYAAQAGVANPPQGRFMGMWSKAVNDYYATGNCHWTNAAADFSALNKQYPQFGGANDLANDARLKAAGETCSTTGGASTGEAPQGSALAGFAIIGGCLFAVLALIAGVIFMVIALVRRRKPTPAHTPTPTPGYPPSPYVRPDYPMMSGATTGYAPTQAPQPYQPPAYTPAPPAPTGSYASGAYPPGAIAPRQPEPSMPATLGPTRFCGNGHVVLESDALFCPLCGAPIAGPPQR